MGATEMLSIRVPAEDIERWKRCAGHGKLSEWIRLACDKQAARDEKREKA
jgi:hypothetical protein